MANEAAAPAASAEGASTSSKKAASVSAPAVSATAAGAKTTSGPAGISSAGPSSHGNPTCFDLDSAQPKDVDFLDWVPEEHSGKVQKRSDKGDKQLAKRLMLQAFSTTIGWRPSGLNVGQAKLFIDRFPSEFRIWHNVENHIAMPRRAAIRLSRREASMSLSINLHSLAGDREEEGRNPAGQF